jgi:cytochrome P450
MQRMTGPVNLPATSDLDHLPGDYGPPILGDTLKVLRDTNAYLERMHARFGLLFKAHTFFEYRVVVVGPEAAEQILMDRNRDFSSRVGWDHFLGRFFHGGLMLRDFDDHRYHRRILQEPFKKPAMEGYLEAMGPIIERHIARWGEAGGNLRFYDAAKSLTLAIASEVFLGLRLGKDAQRVIRDFRALIDASVAVVPVAVPGLAVWRGLRARRRLASFFRALIPERRKSSATDLFTRLCHAESEDGERFGDEEIVDHILFLLFAAHDTTTSALATMAYGLGRHPEWQDILHDEMTALGDGPLDYAALHRMPRTEQVLFEALRLYPPVVSISRRTVREVELLGHRIPENTTLNLDVVLTHRLAEWWSDPHRFDPDRFGPERAEHKAHRFLYFPFGGGAHMCIGMHFAHMAVKAILHSFFPRYRLTLPDGYTMPYQVLPIPRPKDRLPIGITAL